MRKYLAGSASASCVVCDTCLYSSMVSEQIAPLGSGTGEKQGVLEMHMIMDLWRSLGIPQPTRAWLLISEASKTKWKLFYKQTPPCLHPHRCVSCSSACRSWTIKTCTRLLATSLRLRIHKTTRPARLPISCNLFCRPFQISPILVPLTNQPLPRRRLKDRS